MTEDLILSEESVASEEQTACEERATAKKAYVTPKMEIEYFDVEDIITTSDTDTNNQQEDPNKDIENGW